MPGVWERGCRRQDAEKTLEQHCDIQDPVLKKQLLDMPFYELDHFYDVAFHPNPVVRTSCFDRLPTKQQYLAWNDACHYFPKKHHRISGTGQEGEKLLVRAYALFPDAVAIYYTEHTVTEYIRGKAGSSASFGFSIEEFSLTSIPWGYDVPALRQRGEALRQKMKEHETSIAEAETLLPLSATLRKGPSSQLSAVLSCIAIAGAAAAILYR